MFLKTKAIVLRLIDYSDSSKIVWLYTSEQGLLSVFVRHSAKKSLKSLLQPLSLIDVVIRNGRDSKMSYIKEAIAYLPLNNIYFSPLKSTVAIFVAESIYKGVKEQHKDENLYDFLEYIIKFLDESELRIDLLPHYFLAHYSKYIGFAPNIENYTTKSFFDMENGSFSDIQPIHNNFFSPQYAEFFYNTLTLSYSDFCKNRYDKVMLINSLEGIVRYLQIHQSSFSNLRSLTVIRELF